MVQELVDRGRLQAHEAAISRHRNVITRALGIGQDVIVDVANHDACPNDLFMLCSDGVTNMVAEPDIAVTLASHASNLDETARKLVALANERGGRDNISVVLMRFLENEHV